MFGYDAVILVVERKTDEMLHRTKMTKIMAPM